MNVCIGSFGRFHTFDLAKQLQRLGHLKQLYTAYPKWKVDELPSDTMSSFPWFCVPMMLAERVRLIGLKNKLVPFTIESFARWMARKLVPCEVFHCLSGFGVEAHRVAKDRYSALTVCDRGSSHIVYQNEILEEEYTRWRMPYQSIDPRVIERELQEYEESDLIFVPSSFAYRSFVEKGITATKLRTIPYGVDLNLFRPSPKDDDVFRVIYVGTLSLQKGIPYLLDAIASLHIPGLEVWLIGGIQPDVKPFLARHEGRYTYLGRLRRTDLFKYYSQASVFVIPSLQEGLGLVQAQAMACGLPVIGTKNSGAEDLLTDGQEGFILPIRNAQMIREKILYLYENPLIRDEMGKAALRRVQALRGWQAYGDRVAACYEETLRH